MMIQRLFVAVVIVLAVIVGFLNVSSFHSDAIRIASFTEFFSAALPILAFGALIKYLGCCKNCNCKSCASSCGDRKCGCCKGAGCRCCGEKKDCHPIA